MPDSPCLTMQDDLGRSWADHTWSGQQFGSIRWIGPWHRSNAATHVLSAGLRRKRPRKVRGPVPDPERD